MSHPHTGHDLVVGVVSECFPLLSLFRVRHDLSILSEQVSLSHGTTHGGQWLLTMVTGWSVIVSKVLPKNILSINYGPESQDIYFHPHSVWLIGPYPFTVLSNHVMKI